LPEEVCPSGAHTGSEEDGSRRTEESFFEWLRKHL
jgi:hypothetical protein